METLLAITSAEFTWIVTGLCLGITGIAGYVVKLHSDQMKREEKRADALAAALNALADRRCLKCAEEEQREPEA